LAIVLTTLVVVGISVVSYTGGAMPEAYDALRSDARVRVETGRWIAFLPEPPAPGAATMRPPGSATGLILYPGGFVQPEAYAPIARRIAEAGHPVVVVAVTLRLAFFDVDAASPVPAAFPRVARWAVGGHSLGGVASAWFAHGQPEQVAGLVLWASYTDDGHSFADTAMPVLSVSGTRDGNVTPGKVQQSRLTLPKTTRYVAIDGGNHAQFGAYRFQVNDASATMSRHEQYRTVADATVAFLDTLGAP
jgi:dienelactone hydrolase